MRRRCGLGARGLVHTGKIGAERLASGGWLGVKGTPRGAALDTAQGRTTPTPAGVQASLPSSSRAWVGVAWVRSELSGILVSY